MSRIFPRSVGLLLTQTAMTGAWSLDYNARFDQWFQQFSDNMYPAVHNDCWGNYTRYTSTRESKLHPESIASDLIACLLGSSYLTEAIKANMASAQVLLGFLPTFLTFVGCDPSETSLLGLRRPLLAILITIGSPAPSFMRTFEYPNYKELLKDNQHYAHIEQSAWRKGVGNSAMREAMILTTQLSLVLAAAVNTTELACELGFLTVSSFAPSRPWLVILWTILGVLVHIFATIALHLRMTVKKENKHGERQDAGLVARLRDEFSICSTHGRTDLCWEKTESRWTVFVSWFTATGTAAVVVYGTLVFSSLLFISTQDATIIVVRYMLSALLCRAILMFELNGMRYVSRDPGERRPELQRAGTTEMHLLSPAESSEEAAHASHGK